MSWLEIVALAVQVVLAASAVFAALAALSIARRERRQSRLLTELEYAVRLGENRNRGGSSDPVERARLGAEALVLATAVGERWLPRQYARATDGKSREELRAELDAPETADSPKWVKDKIEAGLAVLSILDALHEDEGRWRRPRRVR